MAFMYLLALLLIVCMVESVQPDVCRTTGLLSGFARDRDVLSKGRILILNIEVSKIGDST